MLLGCHRLFGAPPTVVSRFANSSDGASWVPGRRPGDCIVFSTSQAVDVVGIGVYTGGAHGSIHEAHLVVVEGDDAMKGHPLREVRARLTTDKDSEIAQLYFPSALETEAHSKYTIVLCLEGNLTLALSSLTLIHDCALLRRQWHHAPCTIHDCALLRRQWHVPWRNPNPDPNPNWKAMTHSMGSMAKCRY